MQFFIKSGANLEATSTQVTNAQLQYSKKLVKVVKEAVTVFFTLLNFYNFTEYVQDEPPLFPDEPP
jgi:hypothetical protein